MNLTDCLSQSPDAVARDVSGELVILNLESGSYFGLSGVGSFIWQALADGSHTINILCDAVCSEFDMPRSAVEDDILSLASSLLEEGLVVLEEAPKL